MVMWQESRDVRSANIAGNELESKWIAGAVTLRQLFFKGATVMEKRIATG